MAFFNTTSLFTGMVMAGGPLALLVGMHVLSDKDNSWVDPYPF